MAKINSHGCHQIGPTLYTERWMINGAIEIDGKPVDRDSRLTARPDDRPSLYRQAWRLRSDGAVLERIVWVENDERGYTSRATNHPGRSIHTSAFAIRGNFKADIAGVGPNIDALRDYLSRRGYKIVKEG